MPVQDCNGITLPFYRTDKATYVLYQILLMVNQFLYWPNTGPEGSRKLRLPDFKTIRALRWDGCQPYAPATFIPKELSWYSYISKDDSTPGP
jgi:hypothetical protein